MSRYVYRLYDQEEHRGNFSSINHILANCRMDDDLQADIIQFFRTKPFQRIEPKTYVSPKGNIKIVCDYLVFMGKFSVD